MNYAVIGSLLKIMKEINGMERVEKSYTAIIKINRNEETFVKVNAKNEKTAIEEAEKIALDMNGKFIKFI